MSNCKSLTVQELIDLLSKVPDKSIQVKLNVEYGRSSSMVSTVDGGQVLTDDSDPDNTFDYFMIGGEELEDEGEM